MSDKRILIVEDDGIIADRLQSMLTKLGYAIWGTVISGEKALQKIEATPPDLVLMDIYLAGELNGIETTNQIRSQFDIPVVYLTAYSDDELLQRAKITEPYGYLIKPTTERELHATIEMALYKHEMETKQKRTEEALRESEERYRSLVEASPDAITLTDLNANIIMANQQTALLHGFEDIEEMLSGEKNAFDFIAPQDRQRALDNLQKTLETGIARDVEYTLLRKDGASFPAALSASLITDADGNPKAFTAVTRDITEQKLFNEELERRVEQRTKELKETQVQLFQTSKLANLGEMATGLAHEMNQPLAGISLSATYLRKLMVMGKLSQEEIELGLNDIESSVKRMSRIINHVRTFARQETFEFIQVDVNQTIAEALGLLGEQLRLHKIEVVQDLSNDLPKIVGEPYQLEQVWINLITNARDALDEKGEQISGGRLQIADYKKNINISTTYNPESKLVEISVGDNGIGMSEEVKPKVFEPFFTTKEVGKATGLGLSICYGIIKSHKGQIEVESKEGEGTAVKVTLPLEVDDD